MPVTATLVPDRPSIRLSGSLTLKAALEGPAPLRVDVPSEILSEASAPVWRIVPLGPAQLADFPGGTQRWSRDYKLTPFAPGEAVPLSLAEFRVSSGNDVSPKSVSFPALTIRVETTIKNIKAEEARPITGIEELPPPTEPPASARGAYGFAAVVALLLLAGLLMAFRRRRPKPALSPAERALRALGGPDAGDPDRIAAILRGFLSAAAMTTAELLAAHPDAELREILEACDRAKFAGGGWTDAEGALMTARAKAWVRTASDPSEPDA